MRIVILKDKKITDEELDELERRITDMYAENGGVELTFFRHERDYNFYPTIPDSDGDQKPTNKFLTEETDWVKSRYGQWGTDHVVLLIHEDNWKSDPPGPNNGIWGTNWSYIYNGYQVQYCRFDRDNISNSLGTLYHEIMHAADAVIKTELNINIAQFLNVENWDRDVVHGGARQFEYIRWRDNLDALEYISPYLKNAYGQRKARFDQEYQGLQKTVIQLLQTLVVLLRQQSNRKNGVNKLCSKHIQQPS